MKNVLVTGANGQLGQCLQKLAPFYKELDFIFKNSTDLNITEILEIEQLFANHRFDYCINCAAYTNVEQSEITPEIAFKVNAEGVKNLALTCKKHQTFLIHISTDYVFDGEKDEPYTVDDIPNPINEYGKSKLMGEKYIQELMDDFSIIRTSWLYSEFGKNFYKTILQKAQEGLKIKVTDNQLGCPTNASNLARYILDLIINDKKTHGIHHFTGPETMTWFDFAYKILKENGLLNKTSLEINHNIISETKRPKYSVLR